MATQKTLVLFIVALISVIFINSNVVSAPVSDSEVVTEQLVVESPETTRETQSNKSERVKQSETSRVWVKIVIICLLSVLIMSLFIYIRRLHYREKPGRRRF